MARGHPQIIVRLHPKTLEALRAVAQQENRTVSDVVREEIDKLLERKQIDYKAD